MNEFPFNDPALNDQPYSLADVDEIEKARGKPYPRLRVTLVKLGLLESEMRGVDQQVAALTRERDQARSERDAYRNERDGAREQWRDALDLRDAARASEELARAALAKSEGLSTVRDAVASQLKKDLYARGALIAESERARLALVEVLREHVSYFEKCGCVRVGDAVGCSLRSALDATPGELTAKYVALERVEEAMLHFFGNGVHIGNVLNRLREVPT